MVDLLWRAGNRLAAVRLEELWNELARLQCFTLLCAYSMGNFYMPGDGELFDKVCSRHSHVIPADSSAARAVRSLETELEQRKELEGVLRGALRNRAGAVDAMEEKNAQDLSVICCFALAGRQVQMEVPLDQARLIQQIISGFAVRLKTLEIAVKKAVSTETFDEAQKAAANYFETRDIFAELPRVEYVDMLEPLQAIYKILETTSS